jgi:PAS domain S-box-containing protein
MPEATRISRRISHDAQTPLLASIVNSSDDAIIAKTLDGTITSWNNAAEQIYGYAEHEILGKPISLLLHSDRPDEMSVILEKIRSGERVEHYETVRVRKDGQTISISLTVSPIYNDDGEMIGVSSIARDITEQKRSDEQFQRQTSLLASIVNSSDDAIIAKTLDGTITSWNRAAEQIYGYSEKEILGKPISLLLHSDRPDEMSVILEKIRIGERVEHYETVRVRKDGKTISVSLTVSPIYNDDDEMIGVSSIARDITERKRADEQFQRQTSLLASVVNSSDDAIIAKTLDGTITSWNRAAEQIYGYAEHEILGKPISILLHSDRPDEMTVMLEKIRGGQRVEHYETVRVRKDKKTISVSLTVSPILDDSGEMVGVSSIARDITERKRADEQLRAASQYARSLVEASLDPLVTISPEGKITDVNEATIKVTGLPRERLIATDFSDYFTEPEQAREGYKQVFEKGALSDYPLTIRHRDGKLTDVLYNASVYKDARGNVLGVFAAARDVTAQKQASQYARSLIEASLDPLVTISPEGKITDVNEATAQVTGLLREKLIGTDFSDYFTEPEQARGGYKQVFEKGALSDYPLTIRHRDGKLTDVLYNASVYKDARGNVLGVFAAARDVTAQKQASQYARSLIEASLDPLVTISPEGKITDVNEGSIKVTGIARERLIGTDFSDYFTEPEQARGGYQQVFSKGFVTDYPLTIRHRDGKHTNVLYNASVYKDVRGNVLGVFAAARDVTAQKLAEAEVADQRAKELERLAELERFQRLTVGRELKMIELKREIEDLRKSLPPERRGA